MNAIQTKLSSEKYKKNITKLGNYNNLSWCTYIYTYIYIYISVLYTYLHIYIYIYLYRTYVQNIIREFIITHDIGTSHKSFKSRVPLT